MAQKRFSPTKKFNKTNISKAPSDKPIVYKIKKRGGIHGDKKEGFTKRLFETFRSD